MLPFIIRRITHKPGGLKSVDLFFYVFKIRVFKEYCGSCVSPLVPLQFQDKISETLYPFGEYLTLTANDIERTSHSFEVL